MIIVTIYVDDFLIFTNDDKMAEYVRQELMKKFKMKDHGTAKQVLGLRITKGDGTVSIDQESYIDRLLEKFNMSEMMRVPFRQLMGSLQFLAQCTRPDICFAVSSVSSFCSNPGEVHWIAGKRILRYLMLDATSGSRTPTQGLSRKEKSDS